MTIRATNGKVAILIALAAAVFAGAGAYHVIENRRPLLLRQQVFDALSEQRRLAEERRAIERRLVEMKALPRITLRARDLLGMRPPSPDETIRVAEDGR